MSFLSICQLMVVSMDEDAFEIIRTCLSRQRFRHEPMTIDLTY